MFHRSSPSVRLRRPVRGGMIYQLNAKLNRQPAHLTSEHDWKHDQPGVRLSRVFGVVLGIHIIAIGGLMAYEMFRHRDHPAPNTAELRPAARETRVSPPASGSAARPTDTFADDPVHDSLRKHVVAPGERLGDIAAKYGVDEKALMAKNKLGQARAFQSGMKLVIPNRQSQATPPTSPDRLLAAPGAGPQALAAQTSTAPSEEPHEELVAVDPPAYDPSLPTRRAEPVADVAAAKTKPSSAAANPTPRTPAPKNNQAPPKVAQSTKKPPASVAKKAENPPARKSETAAAKPKTKTGGRVHVVKDGETAYRIARTYGVNLDQLIESNGINPAALRPGTTLTIPASR